MDNKPPKSQDPEHNKPVASESSSAESVSQEPEHITPESTPHSSEARNEDSATQESAEPHASQPKASEVSSLDPSNSASASKDADINVVSEQAQVPPSVNSHATPQSTADEGAPKTRKGIVLLIIICLLFSILALAAGGYLYTRLLDQQTQLSEQLAQQDIALQQALAAPQSQLMDLSKQQQALGNAVTKLQQIPAQQKELSDRLATLAKRSPSHWQAAEANYLVTMAGRKLWLEQDPLTAAGLLEAADERIAAMKDPALLPVRKALAKDIAAVKAIKQVDVAGTVFTLDEIISNLDKLPLNRAEAQAGKLPNEGNDELTDSLDDWKSNLSKTWQALLEDFIVVRHRTTDIAPLLTPDEQWYLVENIRSKLLQAQLALYRGDQINYRNSLQMAHDWLYQYYDLSSPEVESTLKVLSAMETLKLSPIELNRFDSSRLLKQLTEQGELQPNTGDTL